MSIVLGNNILDDLLDVVDDIRSLNNDFGTRNHRVFVDIRTYTGIDKDGYYSTTSTELVPTPKVDFPADSLTLNAGGRYSKGKIIVSEVSLTYSEDQLYPQSLLDNQELLYRLVDAHGENIVVRYAVPDKVPFCDRNHKICWIVELTERQIQDDNTNSL